jgi:hypothetical protein
LLVVQRIWAIMPIPQVVAAPETVLPRQPIRRLAMANLPTQTNIPGTLARQKQQYLNQILVHVLD